MIQPKDLIAKFNQALSEGWGYIWGTAGEVWTEQKQRAATREKTLQYGSAWIGKRVADCSGLFTWAFRQLGGTMYHGSNTMYRDYCTAKGRLSGGKRVDGQPLKRGTAVFTGTEADHGHVGLYVGYGTVIEAAGTKAGVVASNVSADKWTFWGELKGVDYSGEDGAAGPASPEAGPAGAGPVQPSAEVSQTIAGSAQPSAEARTAVSGSEPAAASDTPVTSSNTPTLRKGSKGAYVTLLQKQLLDRGYGLGSWGADGDFGSATEKAVRAFQGDQGLAVDGIVGPKTWAALGNPDQPAKRYSVLIPGLSRSSAEVFLAAYPAATMTED